MGNHSPKPHKLATDSEKQKKKKRRDIISATVGSGQKASGNAKLHP